MRQNRAHRIGKRVAKRANELDSLVPGWADKVDLGTLDLMYDESCILGQVYGGVHKSPYAINLPFGYRIIPTGFSFLTFASFAHGTKCWREQVLARRRFELYVPSEWKRDEPVVLPLPGEPDVPWEDAGV